MKNIAWIFLGMLVMLTGACSQTPNEKVLVNKEAKAEKEMDSSKEEDALQGEEEDAEQGKEENVSLEETAGVEEQKAEESTENQEESYIHPELANNAKYVEVMNRIHDKPNKLSVSKEDQYAAVTKLFLLNPEVLDVKSRGLGLSDAHLGDGTKLVYLAAAGEGVGAFYYYHPGSDEIVTEMNAEEAFGEYPELVF